MLINRNNYEEFFLLYVDHELTAAERKAVDHFVKENVDLGEELRHLQHAKMQPDHAIIFENKKSLLKQPSEKYFINELNYEEFFVLFVDGELSEDGRNAVQEFVLLHPQLKQELDLLQQTCLVPDLDIIFEGKEDLFRKEEDTKFVPLPWFRMSAAALVLLLSGLLVFKYAGVRNEGAARSTDRAVADHQAPSTEKKSTAIVTPTTVDSLQHIARVEKDPSTTKVKEQGMVTSKKSMPASQLKEDLPEQSVASLPNVNKETNHLVPVPETTNGQKTIVADQLTASNDPTPKILVPITDHAAQADLSNQMANDNGSRLIAYNESTADRDDEVSFLNASSTGKNKMRGFFRKVTRVFEKRTGIDNENSKSTVLVGNFQIALK